MMKPSYLLGMATVVAALGAGSASAQSSAAKAVADNAYASEVVAGLEADGYRVVELRKSMLGRLRIVVENGVHRREIVVTSTTREIMRDVLVGGNGNGRVPDRSDDAPGNSGSSNAGGNGNGNGGGNGGKGGNGNGNGGGGGNGNGK